MPRRHANHNASSGFTLVELSIVLVIIGLLVGAILVGRDLIRAAEIRATISQVGKFDAAVNTFKLKYNALPGDILTQDATQLGLAAPGVSNGDGFINGIAPNTQEVRLFWTHLGAVGLIPGNYRTENPWDAGYLPANNQPVSKMTASAFFVVYGGRVPGGAGAWGGTNVADLYKNYYAILDLQTGGNPLSPADAFAIDSKTDDGLPLSGVVTARSTPGFTFDNYWSTDYPASAGAGGAGSAVCVKIPHPRPIPIIV